MAPKGGNAKKESGRAKRAENEAKKQEAAAADKERKETEKWAEGTKSNKAKEEREAKRREDVARKAENARLLAEEEAAAPSKVKTAPKAGAKKVEKAATPAGPRVIAAGEELGKVPEKSENDAAEQVESYAASGIDNALDLLEVVTARTDKASVGQQAAGIERHPERRFKAAFEAYKDKELANLKADHPGLRLQQYLDILHKQFQKSPDNPFNQTTVAYDASKEERTQALKEKHDAVQKRMRIGSD